MQLKETIQIVGIVVGIVGGLISACGVLAVYIWRRHVRDSDCCDARNREDHTEIFQRLREIEMKRGKK